VSAADLAAVGLSLRVAAAATALALGPGVALGWALARRRLPLPGLFAHAAMLPLVVPPVVTGYALLAVLPRGVAFTWAAAVLAAAVVGFPLLVQSARVAFEGVDPTMEDAARSVGAGPWEVFRRVTLPLAARGIAAGAALQFGRALGEFGATIVVAGSIPGRTQTLPLALYGHLNEVGGERPALVLALAAVGLSALTLAVHAALARRLPATHA
jgi:molybdate transport system permease protein